MSTDKGYLAFILEQLSEVEGLTHRQMMGEYLLYVHGKIAVCNQKIEVGIGSHRTYGTVHIRAVGTEILHIPQKCNPSSAHL